MPVQMEIINGEKYPVCRDVNGSVEYIIGDPAKDLAKKIAKAQAEELANIQQSQMQTYVSGGSSAPIVWSNLSKKDKAFYLLLSLGGMLAVGALLSVPMALLLLLLI